MYEVKIENIFEGPMDLLVFLIKKNEVDIYDIPIALITDQFLEYIEWMESMSIDFAGDFIVMASTLIQIKSKLLLPLNNPRSEEDDPRLEVVRPILEYMQIKSASEELLVKNILGEDIFSRNPSREDLTISRENEEIKIDLFELIDALQNILDNMTGDHKIDFSDEKVSIKDKIAELIDILEKSESVSFKNLFNTKSDKGEIIITFLAILEMAKLCLIEITQQVQTGDIKVSYI